MSTDEPQIRTHDGFSEVVIEHDYEHPIDEVWDALTDADLLAQWFPGAPDIDLRPGGRIRFRDLSGDPAEFGEVLACEAPRALRFTWAGDALTFELADAPATRVTLTHEFEDRAGAASYATGWESCLAGLGAVLRGEQPASPGPRRRRHEELAAAFGLDQPQVTASAGGWTVLFERQLVCPAATAWNLFLSAGATDTDVEAPAAGGELRAPAAPEVVLGTVTEVVPGQVLAFDTGPGEPGDRVRLELTDGTGHGARLVLRVTGTVAQEKGPAIEQWRVGAVEAVAAQALAAVG